MVKTTRVYVQEEIAARPLRAAIPYNNDFIGGALAVSSAKAEIPVAQPAPLVDLVNYQEGSIVSRVLVGREAGTITLFAFDEEQALSEHTAPFDALVQMLEGEMEISIDRKPLSVKAGNVVLMPANHPHALKAITKSKMLLTMIRSH
jgi:quercetin dioxygenase-like cupin family protein